MFKHPILKLLVVLSLLLICVMNVCASDLETQLNQIEEYNYSRIRIVLGDVVTKVISTDSKRTSYGYKAKTTTGKIHYKKWVLLSEGEVLGVKELFLKLGMEEEATIYQKDAETGDILKGAGIMVAGAGAVIAYAALNKDNSFSTTYYLGLGIACTGLVINSIGYKKTNKYQKMLSYFIDLIDGYNTKLKEKIFQN